MRRTFNEKGLGFFRGLRALGLCVVLFFVSLMFVGNSHCSDGEGGDNSGGSFAVVVLVLSVGALCWGIAKGTELLANKFRQEELLKIMGPDLYQEAAIEQPELLVYVPAHDGGHSGASYVVRCLYRQVWTPPTDPTAIDRLAICWRDAVFGGDSLFFLSAGKYLFAPAFCYCLYCWWFHPEPDADIDVWRLAVEVILLGLLLAFTITVVVGSLAWLYLALICFLEA
jgi:hypothetical protein